MTPITAEEVARLAAKTTLGPWRVSEDNSCTDWSCDHFLVVADDMENEIVIPIASFFDRSNQSPNAPLSRTAEANADLTASALAMAHLIASQAERIAGLEKVLSALTEMSERNAVIEECAEVCAQIAVNFGASAIQHCRSKILRREIEGCAEAADVCARNIRALKSPPCAPSSGGREG